jgi:hypothetical protein
MAFRRSRRRHPAERAVSRTWTACVTVEGYARMVATLSARDNHDDQIMAAAHDAIRLMRSGGASSGRIDLFRATDGLGTEWVGWRIVTADERGLVVSANQLAEF